MLISKAALADNPGVAVCDGAMHRAGEMWDRGRSWSGDKSQSVKLDLETQALCDFQRQDERGEMKGPRGSL